MSINTEIRQTTPKLGNGVWTEIPFTFKIFEDTDIVIVETNTAGADRTMLLGSSEDYTVSLNTNQDVSPGGKITLTSASVTDYSYTATSAVENLQPTVITNLGSFFPSVVNTALDRLTILVQQVLNQAGRALEVPLSDGVNVSTVLPTKALRANKALIFDGSGNVSVSQTPYDDGAFTSGFNVETFLPGVNYNPGVTASLALQNAPSDKNATTVYFDGIYQEKTEYSVTENTITFNEPIPAQYSSVEVSYIKTVIIGSPADGTVTEEKISANAVTEDKVANGAIANSKLAPAPANTMKGRLTDAGEVVDLSVAQIRNLIGFVFGGYASAAQGIKADTAQQPDGNPRIHLQYHVPAGYNGSAAAAIGGNVWQGKGLNRVVKNTIPDAKGLVVVPFDNETSPFTVGEIVSYPEWGGAPAGTAVVDAVIKTSPSDTSGILHLTDLAGGRVIVNNHVLTGSLSGGATVNINQPPAGQVFLPAGVYRGKGAVSMFYTNATSVRLRNEAGTETLMNFSHTHNNNNAGYNVSPNLAWEEEFTLAQDELVPLEYACASSYQEGQAFLSGNQTDEPHTFATLIIEKIG